MTTIEIIRLSLVFVHLIGMAAIVGSWILQMPWARGFDFRPLAIGATVATLSGFALVATREIGDMGVDRLKITVKLVVAIVVLALAVVGLVRSRRLRQDSHDDAGLKPLLMITGLLAMGNVAIAVLWQ